MRVLFFNNSSKTVNMVAFALFVLLVAWFAGYVFSIARALFFQVLLFSSVSGVTTVNDFVNVYMAGKMGLAAHPQPIYDPSYQLSITNKLIAPSHIDKAFLYLYAPFVFLVFAPVALLPMASALIVWVLFSLVFFICCFVLVARDEARLPKNDCVWLLIGTLASLPTYACMYLGQTSLFVVGIVLLYYLAFKRGRDLLAGVLLAFTAIKPHYSPFILLPALAEKRWFLLFIALLTEGLLFAIPGAVFGSAVFPAYVDVLLHGQANKLFWGFNTERMSSFRGVLSMIFPQQSLAVSCALMLVAVSILFCLWRKSPRNNSPARRWLWAITIVAALCFSPHEHLHDCLLMVLPAILTLETVSVLKIRALASPSLRRWHFGMLAYPFLSIIVYLVWEFVPPVRLFATPFLLLNIALLLAGSSYYAGLVKSSRA